MEQMKVGIIGAGRIAANMAKTLDGMDDAAAYAIAARNLDRAQKFAKEWFFTKYRFPMIDTKFGLFYMKRMWCRDINQLYFRIIYQFFV